MPSGSKELSAAQVKAISFDSAKPSAKRARR
jgi:hypothetical protein